MLTYKTLLIAILLCLAAACGQSTPDAPTATLPPATVTGGQATTDPSATPAAASPTAEPTSAPPSIPTSTSEAYPAPDDPTPTETPGSVGPGDYLDDRSSAVQVLRSLVNALNRREYLRAYSYWHPDSTPMPFEEFEQGYQETLSVELETGTVTGDAGAGQFYYSVPVILRATDIDGTLETFAGCYVLHLSNPAVQGVPPFQPMAIREAQVEPVAEADAEAAMESACAAP